MLHFLRMKKIILSVLFVSTIAIVSAQSAIVCTDLSSNLTRGSESKNVLALQNFLYAKGLLKATPNGYFGPGTFAAVKAYQKSQGVVQVGNTGPATRAAIKRDSCVQPSSPVTATSSVGNSTSSAIPAPQTSPLPVLNSLDLVTLFSGGATDWTFNLYGNHFSRTTNIVYFKNTATRRIYTIGTFASADGTIITLPKNITATAFSCGSNCSELLPPGLYEITVATEGGQTDAKTIQVQSFTSSVQTGAVQGAFPAHASNVKFGTFAFSLSAPVVVHAINLISATSTIPGGGYGNTILMDDILNAPVSTAGTAMTLSAFQSKIIDAYVDTNNTYSAGTGAAYFTVTVEDYIGKKLTTFTSPQFVVTIAGVL